ncbi:MAG: MASE3 domain-containing protein [Blastocatellia bacterium]
MKKDQAILSTEIAPPSRKDVQTQTLVLLAALAALLALSWLFHPRLVGQGLAGYVPLHTFLETCSIVVSALVFVMGWHTFPGERNRNLTLLAVIFLVAALLDFLHVGSFPGMPALVTPNDTGKAINFWLAARLLTAAGLLITAFSSWAPDISPAGARGLLTAGLALTGLIAWTGLFHAELVPATFIPGAGLTRFKVLAEYLIVLLNVLAAAGFYRQRGQARAGPQPAVLFYLAPAALIMAMAEIYFTLYAGSADTFNLLGHVYKVIAALFVFRGLTLASLRAPHEALQESQERMQGVIASAMDAIISVNPQQNIVLFNAAAEKMFGYRAEEMIGQPLSRLLPDRFRAAHDGHIRRFGEDGATTRSMGALSAVSGLRRNGGEFPIEASISQVETGREKIFTVILRDITARRRAEQQIREQASLLDHAQEAITALDPTGHVIFWNPGAERLYGWKAEEVLGRNINAEIFRENQTQQTETARALAEKGEWMGEMRQYTRDDRVITVESRHTVVRDEQGRHKSTLVINTDISERKRLEAQFLRAQRMESIGTLAGGIAHDLNNILSPITMGLQMLRMKHTDEFSEKMLGMMATNTDRGAAMIRQILSFARGAGAERVMVQPQHLAREITRLLQQTFPKNIAIQCHTPADLWPVSGDPTQLHQVLMNLCVNARDAMPGGGALTISLENQTLDEFSARLIPGAAPGRFVLLSVNDNGEGIPPEHIARIFDPFFTTKEPGKGTGLGLATVYGIVRAHGGALNVYSQPGAGTEFKIWLPALETGIAQPAEATTGEIPAGHGKLVLVVDDEEAIREMTRAALEAYGYSVLSATNGAEALDLYARRGDEVRLVLTDMMMPVMDGPAMIRALREIDPDLPIVGCSGLTEEGKAAEARELGVGVIIAKPCGADTLLKTVARAICRDA